MWDFEHSEVGSQFEISYTVPSLCAASLQDGSGDIGIIPAAAYTTIPDLVILPDIAIASRRAVRSILLVSKVPLDQIRSVALDNSSMTSVALLKVLFARFWGGARDYLSAPPDLEGMLASNDAGLVIGDPALRIDRSQFLTYDLAEEWIRLTGKPFVFALWAVRNASLRDQRELDLAAIFQQSRDHGLTAEAIERIGETWAPRLKLSKLVITSYLTENIHYFLDPDCLSGLELFYRYAADCGALPSAPKLAFLQPQNIAVR